MKWYKVNNGNAQQMSDEQVEQAEGLGLSVVECKPEISKIRTAFERLIAPGKKFDYLVDMNGTGKLMGLVKSTNLSASKKEVYALIQDQIDNGAETFTEPRIYFIESLGGSPISFGMKLTLNDDNVFQWSPCYEAEGLEYPEEPETDGDGNED